MNSTFATQGTCAKFIDFEIKDDQLTKVRFIGGCNGNLQAVSRLVEGRPCREVIELLRGIECRNSTSCPDQLAQALSKQIQLAEAS
ncbi:MAG: TIGR03905 family TSCPD domain-containing protein [Geopsychrobacter sp.]|nr:TIGR03905 family TSCPD domain-containing protein [Geopsychrobacter sp.]